MSGFDDLLPRIRPEVETLAARGNVTLQETKELRCNSYEWELLIPKMNDEAFIEQMQHALNNCSVGQRPFSTYDKAVCGLYGPELLKRFRQGFRLSFDQLKVACSNIDFDITCGACAERFFTGHTSDSAHDDECATNSGARTFEEVIDGVREALGMDGTHYLCIAGDVKDLVDAIENGSDGAAHQVLNRLRSEGSVPSMHKPCQACSIEAEIGTEENPHPVPVRFHVCGGIKS